eukprot:900564-Pleurochrysis_carterae.AAC.5
MKKSASFGCDDSLELIGTAAATGCRRSCCTPTVSRRWLSRSRRCKLLDSCASRRARPSTNRRSYARVRARARASARARAHARARAFEHTRTRTPYAQTCATHARESGFTHSACAQARLHERVLTLCVVAPLPRRAPADSMDVSRSDFGFRMRFLSASRDPNHCVRFKPSASPNRQLHGC